VINWLFQCLRKGCSSIEHLEKKIIKKDKKEVPE